jgi:hypothetical protein
MRLLLSFAEADSKGMECFKEQVLEDQYAPASGCVAPCPCTFDVVLCDINPLMSQ